MASPSITGKAPLYASRTFVIARSSKRYRRVTITIHVDEKVMDERGNPKNWEMVGPIGKKPKNYSFEPGTYELTFSHGSPQQLVRVKIDPDPGGGVVP